MNIRGLEKAQPCELPIDGLPETPSDGGANGLGTAKDILLLR